MHWIDGVWKEGTGVPFVSKNPHTQEAIWHGKVASKKEIDEAIEAAKGAFLKWCQLGFQRRAVIVSAFGECVETHKEDFAKIISEEVGKPLWESRAEVAAVKNKIDISIQSYQERCSMRKQALAHGASIVRHRPHGVVAVFGPFNFPAHLPNGHIIPALLAGNSIVFKPSEYTPAVAEEMVRLWIEAGLPEGVINLVQGGQEVGQTIVQSQQINGLFFTGSAAVGKEIARQSLEFPQRILALEMGGNNPLVISAIEDIHAAVLLTIQSAFLSAGQRCSCARRLFIVETSTTNEFLKHLIDTTESIAIGPYTMNPEPFMGPLITVDAANRLRDVVQKLTSKGKLLTKRILDDLPQTYFLPTLVDMTGKEIEDAEYFGPILQIKKCLTFEEAVEEANNTAYGLSSGLISTNSEEFSYFLEHIRAGIVNWNSPLTGALSSAPFGGIGKSGNYRPSAYYAADYCSYPVASIEAQYSKEPIPQGITFV